MDKKKLKEELLKMEIREFVDEHQSLMHAVVEYLSKHYRVERLEGEQCEKNTERI